MGRGRAIRQVSRKSQSEALQPLEGSAVLEKRFSIFVFVLLLCFGIYHSILYFGHQVVPCSDFPAFARVARAFLSFELPSNYKRAPVLGFLHVGLSSLVGGQYPDLTAGRLLNAILHPLNIVLLWLIGKKIIGRAAVWFAIIAIINPYTMQLLAEPIAETTLLFFFLLTFYLILKRSAWCYVIASITTMVRYEGAALILVAFIMDMIEAENKKQRITAFVYSAVASIPLGLWMVGTIVEWKGQGATHYLKDLGTASGGKIVWMDYISLLWQMGFYPLFMPKPTASREAVETLLNLSRILVAGSFVFGAVYGLCKRRWEILVFLIFLVFYIFVHAVHAVVLARYCTPVYWIVLLICIYGLQGIWRLINKGQRVPKPLVVLLQGVLMVGAVIWLISLVPYLSKIAPMSRRSGSIPYVAGAVIWVIFLVRRFFYKAKYLWRDVAVSFLMCLIVVSNQFMLVRVVGNGQRDMEFKLLADWYVANAKPGEKLVGTMTNVMNIFTPEYGRYFVHTAGIKAESPEEFARKCYDKNITYVTWDSRIGFHYNDLYYKLWGIKNTAILAEPRSVGPYEFVEQIRVSERRFLNIFKLRKRTAGVP